MPGGEERLRRQRRLDAIAARRVLLAQQEAQQTALERSARQRFDAWVAAGGNTGALGGDDAVLELLAGALITGTGRVAYASNAVFVLELDAPDPWRRDRRLRAIYKPALGERPLWDFPWPTLHFREVATFLVDHALGLALIPPTTLRDGPAGPGSVQLFVDAVDHELDDVGRARLEAPLRGIAALDVLVNNADRKSAHLLVTDRGLRGIDHGLTFLPYPRQRTVLLGLGGERLPTETATAISALAADPERRSRLERRLLLLLDGEEVAAFLSRLDGLAADPFYPRLDPWDGRPFEWW